MSRFMLGPVSLAGQLRKLVSSRHFSEVLSVNATLLLVVQVELTAAKRLIARIRMADHCFRALE